MVKEQETNCLVMVDWSFFKDSQEENAGFAISGPLKKILGKKKIASWKETISKLLNQLIMDLHWDE